MSRNSRVFTTESKNNIILSRSTWVEIQVCLQPQAPEITVRNGSTWVEIHVCLQLSNKISLLNIDLHE